MLNFRKNPKPPNNSELSKELQSIRKDYLKLLNKTNYLEELIYLGTDDLRQVLYNYSKDNDLKPWVRIISATPYTPSLSELVSRTLEKIKK